MFAVLKTGGKQYRVKSGDILRIEKLEAAAGDTITFDHVLMLGGDTPVIGTPTVAGASVTAEVLQQTKGEKLIHYVKRRRKHGSQRRKGHRQNLTVIRVTDIAGAGGKKTAAKKAKTDAAPETAATEQE